MDKRHEAAAPLYTQLELFRETEPIRQTDR
jgi:hypothetical protein